MMYGITVDGRLTEVVSIPEPLPHGADVAAFLAVQFPGLSGWKQVPDDAFNGTIDNGDGSFTNPPVSMPTVPRILTRLEFKRRFTPQERIAIRASADAIVFDFMDLLETAEDVNLDDPDLIAGVNYLETTAQLIASGRAAELLG